MSDGSTILRHALVDRIFHWVTAAAALTLLGTAFLPILGVMFPWVTAHWIAGLVLAAAVLFHVVRALGWQNRGAMWIGAADLRDGVDTVRFALRASARPPRKPGKYSLAQKLIHALFAVVILTTVVTGGLMLVRIDTPFWERDPYWLSSEAWGLVYVLHDLAALMLISMVIVHVYFALRPEKLLFTRAMLRGRITREEYLRHHDPARWQVEP
ncbi:MAG TPA: cytochrome b/b6 domain-containing protein [Gammaproteobacteria bacterium]